MLTAEICEAILRDHSRKPRNTGECEQGFSGKTVNPACGDEVQISLTLDEAAEKLACVRFTGAGCAASQSSASLWVTRLQDMAVDAALSELDSFCNLVESGSGEPEALYETFGDAAALLVFSRIPARQRCATLAPRLLVKLIKDNLMHKKA